MSTAKLPEVNRSVFICQHIWDAVGIVWWYSKRIGSYFASKFHYTWYMFTIFESILEELHVWTWYLSKSWGFVTLLFQQLLSFCSGTRNNLWNQQAPSFWTCSQIPRIARITAFDPKHDHSWKLVGWSSKQFLWPW